MHDLHVLLRRYLAGAWRHRWIAVGVAWLICAAGWATVSLMPNVYEADARLYVDADAVLTPLLKGLALDNNPENQLEVLQRTLLSRPNLENLISKTDLGLTAANPADRERLVARLGHEIKVVPQTHNLFTISYRNTRPQLAYDVVQTIVNIFVETRAGNSHTDMANAERFLQQQIDSYEQQLRTAERKRADFRAKYVDLLPSDTGGSSKLEEARAAVRSLQGQLTDTIAKRARLHEELATTPQVIVTETDPGTAGGGGGNTALAQAELRLQEMLVSDTEANPEVIRQRALIARLRKSGVGGGPVQAGRPARSQSVPNQVYAQLKVEAVNTDGEIASLTRQVQDATHERDRLEQIARTVPGLQAQYINLGRDYDVVRKNYDALIARREEMRMSQAASTTAEKVKLQVVDPPQVPRIPVAPRRILYLSGVLVVGLGAGIAAAGALVQLDRSFYTLRELRGLGLPVAGSISMAATRAARSGWRAAFGAAAVCASILLLCGVYGGLLWRVLRMSGAA